MCLLCLQNKLFLVILIALLQPLLYVGPDWFNPCGGCDCCVSSWQQSSGSLLLFQVMRRKHTVTLTPDAPIPLGGRSKTSQQNLQGMFFIVSLSLFYVLPVSPSPSPPASWSKLPHGSTRAGRGNLNRPRLQLDEGLTVPRSTLKVIFIESVCRDCIKND